MPTKNTATALQIPVLTDDEITRTLRGAGVIEEAAATNRIKIEGTVFMAGDQMYPYNPASNSPAFLARLCGPLREYQGFYFRSQDPNNRNWVDEAAYASRPDIADQFCKSYKDIPEQGRRFAQDGTECRSCPFNPFVPVDQTPNNRKCQWRGELELQIIPETGQLTGEEPIWLLDMSTTAVIEMVGSKKNPTAGRVSPYNFMHKLARLAADNAVKDGGDSGTAILRAIDSYNKGGVVAEFRLLGATSDDGAQKWRVVSLEPVAIIDIPDTPAIEAGLTDPADDPGNADLPF